MTTLTSSVIEIVVGGKVIIYGDGSTPVITQEITQETTTTPANKAVFESLENKADKVDANGNKVVYAPNGIIDLEDKVVIIKDGDTITKDGSYLFIEDGEVIVEGLSIGQQIPESEVNIRGYVAFTGAFEYNASFDNYARTGLRNIPSGAVSVNVLSMASSNVLAIAFYTSSGTFISGLNSSNAGEQLSGSIPANATQYALTKRDTYNFGCTFLITSSSGTIENDNAITLIEKVGDVINTTILKKLPVVPDNILLMALPNENISKDGNYLIVKDGNYLLGGKTEELHIPEGDVNISGFVALSDGSFNPSANYNRTNKRALPTGATYVKVGSILGIGATPIAFYTSSGTFISSVANTGYGDIIEAAIPVNAAQYALSKRIDSVGIESGYVYECTFLISNNSITNKDAITLLEIKDNAAKTTLLRDFSGVTESEKAIQKASMSDMTLSGGTQITDGYQVTASNIAAPRQVYHPVYTTIERMLFDVSFTVSSVSTIIQIGKGYCYVEISGNQMSVYRINDALNGSSLVDTFTMPFSLSAGIKYNVRIHKIDGLRLRYSLTSSDNNFEKLLDYNSGDSLNAIRAWGNAFFGVKNGTVIINSATIATGYNEETQVSFWGDSFLDAGNLLGNGGKWTDRYCDLVSQKIGYRDVPIMARTGQALDASFVTRFKVENSYFKSKYVFLGLGTNNTNLAGYTPYLQQCIDEAKANNQIPILVTITPRADLNYTTITKVMNDWVKASEEKYVDICDAVTDGNGTWKPQYLASDGVHPTVAGELAMYRRIIIDCPEIFY